MAIKSLETKIAAVLVAYYPVFSRIEQLCRVLYGSGVYPIVVDNTPETLDWSSVTEGSLIHLGSNKGIAAAQNRGLKEARDRGYSHVVFFDQDSFVEHDTMRLFLRCYSELSEKKKVLAPLFVDEEYGFEYPFVRVDNTGRQRKVTSKNLGRLGKVDLCISSGTIASMEVFEEVGDFLESLFIDYVDTEWCFRCKAKKVDIYACTEVRFRHRIGDKTLSIGRKNIPVHSPVRRIYRIRNSILLLRIPHVPTRFALRELGVNVAHQLWLLLFVPKRAQYFVAGVKGIFLGLMGRGGGV